MNKQFILVSTILIGLISPYIANGQIYKHVDANGKVTYSNVKIKGGKKLDIEPADTNFGTRNGDSENVSAPKKPSNKTSPASFPKVDEATQQQRDNSRKQILMSELESEKIALIQAQKALEEGKANPEVFRTANGAVRRNVAKFQDKVENLQNEVNAHERNIELLQKEISGMN